MITMQDRQAFSDLSVIFTMMPKSMIDKINIKFINFVQNNKDENYVSKINPSIALNKQNLEQTTKTLLALIYRDYLCDDKERKKLIEQENYEIQANKTIEEEIYAVNFKSSNINEVGEQEESSLIVYKKENIFSKMFTKLKNIFKLKHS